jgi:DNA polymerase V
MKQSVIALVDCNNFFVSCERLFRPDLEGRPVVVLSSNDGCAVSRSNEAKAIGIPMGAPAFKYKQIFKEHGVVQFSANFELYGDISSRITRVLSSIVPRTEVYSVDESFLDLTSLNLKSYTAWASLTKHEVLKKVGIPVAIGVAGSKTLAKLAAERAKKDSPDSTILDLASISPEARSNYLIRTSVNDIWGVGWRLGPKLRAEGVNTALDLSQMDPRYAQQLMGIHGRQMVYELNGENCHPIKMTQDTRQSIMHGRMFGEDTNQPNVIEAAVASLTAKATRSLRREGLLGLSATVVLKTNRHKPNYRRLARTINFDTPTSSPGLISSSLFKSIENLIKSDVWLHKADVYIHDLVPEDRFQLNLNEDASSNQINQSQAILRALDNITDRFGDKSIALAAESLSNNWRPKRKLISPHYTTDWKDLPVIR